MLGEGYVTARTWPEKNYCALDVHLWGSFHKLDLAKKEILNAVGGKPENSSAFRIVAAGMFGVESWKDDDARKGPKLTQQCEDAATPAMVDVPSSKVVSIALEESMEHLLTKDRLSVAVLCGAQGEECESASVLTTNDSADTDSTCPVRFITTQPTQALGMMNSEFTNRLAGKFAAFVRQQAGDDVRQQIKLVLERVTQRPVRESEIVEGESLIQSWIDHEDASPEQALEYFCLMALNLNEFVYVD